MGQSNLEFIGKPLRVRIDFLSDHNKNNTHSRYHIHMDHTYQAKCGS